MNLAAETRAIRRQLFQMLDEPPKDGPISLLHYQLEVADSIRAAERCAKRTPESRDEMILHIERLRSYGDGLAWRLLHPHAIRQLAKNQPGARSVEIQGTAFDNVLAHAGSLCASTQLPVLISDLTNVLRLGDLILVHDEDRPTIVECKNRTLDPRNLMQGRHGRQLSKAIGTDEYLEGHSVKVFGENLKRSVTEWRGEHAWHWEEVASVCNAALRERVSSAELSPGNWLWVFLAEAFDTVRVDVDKRAVVHPMCQIGTSLSYFPELSPPPSSWPLPADVRFGLQENELIILRLLDMSVFAGDHDGCHIEVHRPDQLRVSIGSEEVIVYMHRFAADVMFSFMTVESCIQQILSVVRAVDEIPRKAEPPPSSKPAVHLPIDFGGLETLLSRRSIADHDIAVLEMGRSSPLLLGRALVAGRDGQLFSIFRVGDLRRMRKGAT